MSGLITCRCGWSKEVQETTATACEVEAEYHLARDPRRPYRHDTEILIHEEAGR